MICGLIWRFESLREIFNFLKILCTFEDLSDEIKASARNLEQNYATEISNKICDELNFVKKIYRTNFLAESTQTVRYKTY
jgi:hypothetical protein